MAAQPQSEPRAEPCRLAPLWAQVSGAGCALEDGWLLPGGLVELSRSVPDIDENRRRTLQYRLRCSAGAAPCALPAAPTELPEAVSAALPSPSGRLAARVLDLRGKKQRTCVELWSEGCLVQRVDCSSHHGRVRVDKTFGGFSWSPDEGQVVYVAEEKASEPPGLYDPPPREPCAEPPGSASWFREDWGEKLGGTHLLALFVLSVADGRIRKLQGVPEGVTPGQPAFWRDRIVYAGWPSGARRLGLLLCAQRPCALYAAPLPAAAGAEAEPPHPCLTVGLKLARCPRPSPDGARLAFLGSSTGFDTHGGCHELFVLDDLTAVPRCVVEAVRVPESSERPSFTGIYNFPIDPALPRSCWCGGRIYFNAPIGSEEAVWHVDAEGAAASPARLPPPRGASSCASVRLVAASDEEGLLLAWSDPCRPCELVLRPAAEADPELQLPTLQPCAVVAGVTRAADVAEGMRWMRRPLLPSDGGAAFDAILLEPVEAERCALVLFIHGGPHSVWTTWFNPHALFLARALDCAVLQVNYRGSSGFGQAALESIAGRVGEQDVSDCVQAVREAVASCGFDERRVAVVGGSHGGFLAAHLIGQHPDMFSAAAIRNPVTNMASMVTATDIPDWIFIEGLGVGKYDFQKGSTMADAEVLSALWRASPCAHVGKAKTPTLVALGMKDRRVPPSQGLEYYHSLRARGVPARLLCYPEDTHALETPETDADHLVNVARWLQEHMPPASRG